MARDGRRNGVRAGRDAVHFHEPRQRAANLRDSRDLSTLARQQTQSPEKEIDAGDDREQRDNRQRIDPDDECEWDNQVWFLFRRAKRRL